MPVYGYGKTPIILAHRGGSHEYPENSRTAFEAMRNNGFRYIETDVHATRDGVAVIIHDPRLERTSDGRGSIAEQTWEHINTVRTLDGERIMRLDDALHDFPDTIFNIDIKNDRALDPTLKAIQTSDAHGRVCLASFNARRLKRVRRAMPTVATSIGNAEAVRLFFRGHVPHPIRSFLPAFAGTYGGSVQAVQLPLTFKGIAVITPALIKTAHESNLAVHAWTINDIGIADRLISWGIDGIVTDRPHAMRDALGI